MRQVLADLRRQLSQGAAIDDQASVASVACRVLQRLDRTQRPALRPVINATGIAAKRTARFGQTLGTQITLLAAGAYTFDNDAAVALSVSYAFEGDATNSDGTTVAESSKRLTTLSLSGLWPVSDAWRLSAGLYVEPPLSGFGTNQPSVSGLTLTVIRSWS